MRTASKQVKARAIQATQQVLAMSPEFAVMPEREQHELFRDEYQRQLGRLTQQMAGPSDRNRRGAQRNQPDKASDHIDDERHENRRIDQAGQLAGEFVREVNFPQFVKDLLKGVFDANLQVTMEQMKAFQELLKTSTASLSKFVREIDDTAAFGYLADNNSDDFNIDFSDEEKDESGQPKAILTDSRGYPVDTEDTRIKTKIMDAKIAMAREQRRLLRETLLMGVTRLVVERGQVKASVIFDMKASEKIQKADKAALKNAISHGHSMQAGGGLIGKIFGGPSGGHTFSQRKTEISISSAKSEANTELAAKLTGSVDLTFKSDYFPLADFKDVMLAEIGAESGAAAGAAPGQAAGGGAPAPGAPPRPPAPALPGAPAR